MDLTELRHSPAVMDSTHNLPVESCVLRAEPAGTRKNQPLTAPSLNLADDWETPQV